MTDSDGVVRRKAVERILEIEGLPATPELQEEWRALHVVAFGGDGDGGATGDA